MKNLKFFTCKRHDALTWKNPWIDITIHDLSFYTQVGPKEKQNKTKQTVKKEKKNQFKTQNNLKVNDNVIWGQSVYPRMDEVCGYSWDVN